MSNKKFHAVTLQALLSTQFFLFCVNELQIYGDESPLGDGCSHFMEARVKPGKKKKTRPLR